MNKMKLKKHLTMELLPLAETIPLIQCLTMYNLTRTRKRFQEDSLQ